MTVALTVSGSTYPGLEDIRKALERPCRPLYIGRKTCLPARPLLDPFEPIRGRIRPFQYSGRSAGVGQVWTALRCCAERTAGAGRLMTVLRGTGALALSMICVIGQTNFQLEAGGGVRD